MSNIDTRASFFPNSKTSQTQLKRAQEALLRRNTEERASELKQESAEHADVQIPEAIRDFSKIKRAVDAAEVPDNSARIAQLKQQIADGTYNVDFEAVADKMLQSEY